jgi:hypothetical protein
MTHPYQIEPPALISFSGGRTSGYLLQGLRIRIGKPGALGKLGLPLLSSEAGRESNA